MQAANSLIGTSGFTLQHFYPEDVKSSDKLSYYATKFPTVEINSSFYHIPRATTLTNWLQAVPTNFIFTFKAHRSLTHDEHLLADKESTMKWLELFTPFSTLTNQQLILFQFPASYTYDASEFNKVLSFLPDTFLYAFEFRHPSWFVEDVYQKIIERNHALVLADSPIKATGAPQWPTVDLEESQWSYIRFHGSPKLYSSSYTDVQLETYVSLIAEKVKSGKTVYSYFNNDAKGFAAENAQRLETLVGMRS